jgi:hypothetical protein
MYQQDFFIFFFALRPGGPRRRNTAVPSAEVRQRYQDSLIGTRAGQCRLCSDWYHYSVQTDYFLLT